MSDEIRTAVSPETIQGLGNALRGPLFVSGDGGYDESRSLWNGMIDRRPLAVARCLGTADILKCVAFAREHRVPLTIKGGGHNISGLAAADGALMLDMSLMRGVRVDRKARVAHAQAGCLLGDVDRETQVHGLAAVLGFVSNTGIAGLTLGGGFGYLTRRYGWSSDNVVSMDVVTADGRVVRAAADENPDLFWGLSGGGGNFGIVTSFEYRLYPLGPEIMAGAVAWSIDEAPGVLALYREMVAAAPPELTLVAIVRFAPPAPWIRPEFHGKPVIVLMFCHSGSVADGQKLAGPIKSHGSPVGDVLVPRPYTVQQTLLDATQPKGRRYYWKSEYLPGVDAGVCDGIVAHGVKALSPHCGTVLFPIDGALNRLPEDHSPAGNRTAKMVLNITASWEKPADDAANIAWARDAWGDMRRFSTGGTYVNFLTEEEGDDRIRAAYGRNYDRLIEVKSRWDPDNLFHANKNIAPKAR